ncbi:Mitochondrial dicarboxylate transporter [Penicillium pulvis]|uniref:Mitochondrial dicarboxylate transporter n=1 Tax=Penicillium pulvis TaxID=1562058 RepID=UPI002549B178|nr:Mitochondrial dicarboxylate transporter [Penicillium pulvis]KAJ5813672.1 Mitochondrial dicarboxylate transporter [Penicillium pulvis]
MTSYKICDTSKMADEPRSDAIQYPWWLGGAASCFAVVISHPMDLALYGTSRFAVYDSLKWSFGRGESDLDASRLLLFASLGGGFGAIVGCPAEVANIRMQTDTVLPPEQRRNYNHVFDAWRRIAQEDGIQALYRGVGANTIRSAIVTGGQLASYDLFKKALVSYSSLHEEMTVTHLTASILAGTVTTCISNPIDVIKTQMMRNLQVVTIPVLIHRNVLADGIWWIFRGWVPSFLRLVPHTTATFLFLEQLRSLYRTLYYDRIEC